MVRLAIAQFEYVFSCNFWVNSVPMFVAAQRVSDLAGLNAERQGVRFHCGMTAPGRPVAILLPDMRSPIKPRERPPPGVPAENHRHLGGPALASPGKGRASLDRRPL